MPHIVFMVLGVVGFLVLGGFIAAEDTFRYKKAKNVARSAFVMREDEEDALVGELSRSRLEA